MKATMQSTGKMVIINGMNFRVWEGVSEKGTRFLALVNRIAGVDEVAQAAVIAQISAPHKDFDETLSPVLTTLDPLAFPPVTRTEAQGG